MVAQKPQPSRPMFRKLSRHIRAGEEVRWLSRVSNKIEAGVVIERHDSSSYVIAHAAPKKDPDRPREGIVVSSKLLRVRAI